MCKLDLVFTAEELKALDKRGLATLLKHGTHLVQTSPAIRNIVTKDPKVRKKLKAMLRPTYNKLKRK
jgi:hypothetical protein